MILEAIRFLRVNEKEVGRDSTLARMSSPPKTPHPDRPGWLYVAGEGGRLAVLHHCRAFAVYDGLPLGLTAVLCRKIYKILSTMHKMKI